MKKLLAELFTGLLAVVCLFTICACAPAPTLDINEAKKTLEENGYEVSVTDEDFYEYEYAMEKMLSAYHEDYDDGIYIYEFKDKGMAKKYYEEKKASFDLELKELKALIETKEYYLKEYSDKISSDEIDEIEDSIKECKNDLEEAEEIVFGHNGNFVWYGTKDAIEATK